MLLACHGPGELLPMVQRGWGKEAQGDNTHCSEVLEVARCAIAYRVAGGKPS